LLLNLIINIFDVKHGWQLLFLSGTFTVIS